MYLHSSSRLVFIFLSLFLIQFKSLLAQQETSSQTEIEERMEREEEETFKEERQRWMDAMHRADPEVNVRVLNEETRRSKLAAREKEGRQILSGNDPVDIGGSFRGYWSERGSNNQAGRTLSADIDYQTGTVYVAADGGQIWRGTLDGKGWRSLNDNRRFSNVRMLRVVRTDELFRIIVVFGSVILYSDNDGGSWESATGLEDIQRWGGFSRAIMTDGPEHVIYALGSEWNFDYPSGELAVLYRSTDFGTSFTKVSRFNQSQLRMDISSPPGKDWTYLFNNDTLARVNPDGSIETVVTPITIDGGTDSTPKLIMRASRDNVLYILAEHDNILNCYLSADGGRSWTYGNSIPHLFDRNSFAVSPTDPSFLAIGGLEMYLSTDAGIEWHAVSSWTDYYSNPGQQLHADIPFIGFFSFPDGTEKILISTDGGLFISDDSLRSVTNITASGLGNGQYYSVYTARIDTNYIFAGSQDQGFQQSVVDDGGILNFTQTKSGDYGHITSGDNGRSIWANYPGFSLYYSHALGGILFPEDGYKLSFPTQGQLWLPPIVADPDSPAVAYLAGGGLKGGTHLVRIGLDTRTGKFSVNELPYNFALQGPNSPLTAFAVSPIATNNWYVMTDDSRFFTSTDRGNTWSQTEKFNTPGSHYFYGASIVPSGTTPGLLYIAGSGYSNPAVWVSRDNGKTFTAMSTGLPPTLVYDLAASKDDRVLFAATAVGPYMYLADKGAWIEAAGSSAPDQIYWSVDYIDQNNVARFGTYGRGIWDLRLVETPSGVREIAEAPASLHLSASPIDQTTTAFNLDLSRNEETSLRVYDLSGNMVAILYDGPLQAGTHRFIWDGRAAGGEILPSGHYFCVAAASGTIAYAKGVIKR